MGRRSGQVSRIIKSTGHLLEDDENSLDFVDPTKVIRGRRASQSGDHALVNLFAERVVDCLSRHPKRKYNPPNRSVTQQHAVKIGHRPTRDTLASPDTFNLTRVSQLREGKNHGQGGA